MSNYSEHTQLPFGDGDGGHVPPEEGPVRDIQPDTPMQTAIKNIFISCDPNGSNLAKVSDIISFMTPHMEDRAGALTVLKIALDPAGTDPHVDRQTFINAMVQWTSEFLENPEESDTVHNTADEPTNVKEKDCLNGSSGSKTSIGQYFLKNYVEADSVNLSNSSTYSGTGNSGIDVSVLQERINELEHQNRKLTEDLEHSRNQLTNSEEQVEALHADVHKIKRRLLVEQQTNAQLEKEKQNTEELMEASTAARKQISKLEKHLASAEKEVSKLKLQVHNLELENQKAEDKIHQLVKRDGESKKTIKKLQAEVLIKEQDVMSLEDSNSQKDTKLNEQKQLISHYVNVNKSLKEDKIKMEQQYRDAIKSQILTGHLERVSQTFTATPNPSSGNSKNPSTVNPECECLIQPQDTHVPTVNTPPMFKERRFHSPLAKLYKNKGFIYNSPRLLNMVANPVSPYLENSTIASSAICKTSVDSDDSPLFLCSEQVADSVFAYTSSTPAGHKKTLLDQTPPSIVRKLPVLPPIQSSPTHQHRRLSTSPRIKRDLTYFRQYRFVGHNSSDEEELEYETTEHPEIDLLSASQFKQEYDSNLNIVTNLEEQEKPLMLLQSDGNKNDNSLPTMYVVERSLGRPRSKSASNGNPHSLKSIADLSGEEEHLLWKLSQNVAPHESLENEIFQARLMDSEITELKNTVQHLLKENNRLKLQSSAEKVKKSPPEKREYYLDEEHRSMKAIIQELESDNNRKYIKIIDLMEEKEKLQKELKRVSGKDGDEINKLKQNLSELHHEKCRILRELQQEKSGKQGCDAILTHLQSIKRDCDLLQNLLSHSRKNGEDLSNELDKICIEKKELRTKIDKLKNCMCKVNEKNTELNLQLQILNDEYLKLKKSIYVRTPEEMGLLNTVDNGNLEVSKTRKANEESAYGSNSHDSEGGHNGNSKGFHLLVEEVKTLNNITAEHKCIIQSLKKEIVDLSAINSRLCQNIAEKENQIVALKQIITHQNESLKEITCDRETSTTRLYEQKCENDKLYESNKELTKSNKELTKTNNELMRQLEHIQKEKEYLGVRIQNLEEENNNILTEFKIIVGDYKNVKDSDNQLLKEYKLLVTEKELLTKNNEQLENDHKRIMELKELIEKQLVEIQNEAVDLSDVEQNSVTSKPMKKSPRRKNKGGQDHDEFRKGLSVIREKIVELENSNKVLQAENEKLQQDFSGIRSNYEDLAGEKEMWIIEKNEWQHLKDELSKKLMNAMAESKLLEDQLNNCRGAEESMHGSDSSCGNCLILKAEKEDLIAQVNDLQDQNNKKSQNRKYDKMQAIIEKLKNRAYGAEEQFKNEQEKNSTLEKENSKLKLDAQENWKKYRKENSSLEKENSRLLKEIRENLDNYNMEKVEMVAKHSNLEGQLMKLQKGMQELQQEKKFVLQDLDNLKEKLDDVVREKENRVKSINRETIHLKQEIQELIKQKVKLEKKLATTENLLKCKPNVEKINKENSQLKQEIQENNKQIADYEKKLGKLEQDLQEKLVSEHKLIDHQESLVTEISDIKQQMEDLENKFKKSQDELQKSEAKNLCIRKELVDKQTESNYVIMKSSECSIVKTEEESSSLQRQLKNYENELVDLKVKLNDASNCLHLLSEYVKDVNQNLNERRLRLNRSTLTVVSNWRTTLENIPDEQLLLEALNKGEPGAPEVFVGPMDEEMFKFQHQIHVTSLILDTLGKLQIPCPLKTPKMDVQVQVSPASFPPRRFKRFNVTKSESSRTSTESPSPKGKSRSANTSPLRSKDVRALPHSSDESPRNEVKLFHSAEAFKLQNTSPLRTKRASAIPVRSRDTSPINKSMSYINSDRGTRCFIDTNLVCYKLPRNDDTEDSMSSQDEEVEVEVGANKSSPTLSGSTLEGLGLLNEVDSINWTKKEIEEKFHILVTCFMMDVGTINERFKKHQTYQSKIEDKFFLESEKVVATLKNIKKSGTDHQTRVLVTTCLRQVKHIIGVSSQISILATQFGALQHEQHSLKIINVMINHAANLRQVVENTSPRLKSIRSSTNSPRRKKSDDVLVRKGSDSSIQLEVSPVFKLSNEEGPELPTLGLKEADDVNDLNHHTLASISPDVNQEAKQPNEEHCKKTGFAKIRRRLLLSLLLLLAVIAVGLISFAQTCNDSSTPRYPWRWVSWNDVFTPFIQLTYPQGPPPT